MPRPRVSGPALVFALLVLATVAAFGLAQRAKRDPLVLDRASFTGEPVLHPNNPIHSFTPNGDCHFDRMRIRFRVTRSDDATVQVVKPGGRVVVTLGRDEFLKRYHYFTYHWDGRQRGGGIARPGRYKLRVTLLNEGRTLVTPGVIKLHRARKQARSACETRARGGGVPAGAEGGEAAGAGAGAGAGATP
jgi:hypothetical protein